MFSIEVAIRDRKCAQCGHKIKAHDACLTFHYGGGSLAISKHCCSKCFSKLLSAANELMKDK